ncbi:hypothetical protein AAG747_08035 [Rapidithrix thailandica]|uniref:Uncharacterized protein n=1 Tax=Rapidithrix thailandica TaxID=413964 RepID=A0AAW9S4H7_9BACT
MPKCSHCGRDYTAVRVNQKYCSEPCRKRAWRQSHRTTPKPMKELTEETASPGPQSWKDYVIQDLQAKVREFREENRTLKHTLENTKSRLQETEKDLAFKDRDYELQLREREQSRKGGLEGIVESAYQHPEATSMLLQSLSGFLGAMKGQTPAGIAGAPESDPDIENFTHWYKGLGPADKQAFGQLLQAFSQAEDYPRAASSMINALSHDSTVNQAV